MSEAPSLDDFFKKNKKKVLKGTNLNATTASGTAGGSGDAPAKPKAKNAEEQGWADEEVVVPTMKVEIAGKLTREEVKDKEEEVAAPAWGSVKQAKTEQQNFDRKYPTLAKSIQSSNIQIDDGEAKVNISVSKNKFSSLEDDDDDEDGPKRPQQIKPVMVQKKKGEFEKAAVQREVDKYAKPKTKKEEEAEAGEEAEAAEAAAAANEERKKEKKAKKDEAAKKVSATEEEKEVEEDLKIQPNLKLAKDKYKKRRKLPKKDLPAQELEEEKENKPLPAKKKKWAAIDEEEESKPKLKYLDE